MGRAAAVTRYVDADPIALEYAWRQRQQAKTFRGWLGHCSPHLTWTYPHLEVIRSALDRAALTVGIEQPGVEGEQIRRLAISIPPQHGKELAHSTPIWTPKGWRRHGDIVPGDFVFGRDGKRVRVIAIGPETYEKCEVEFSDGGIIRCHPMHEWIVRDRKSSLRLDLTIETRNLTDIRLGPSGRGGRWRWQVDANVPIDRGEVSDLPLPPYFLGAWLGDGTASIPRITTGIVDEEAIIGRLAKLGIHRTGRYPNRAYDGRSISHDFTRQGIRERLRALGVFRNKHIPEAYLLASRADRLELLAGLIDTDGYVYHVNGRSVFSTSEPRLADDVSHLIRTLGWRTTQSVAPPTSSGRIVSRKPCIQVTFSPTEAWPSAIERKRPLILDPRSRQRAIVDVRQAEDEPGRCIEVEGGVYLAGPTMIPTHNSSLSTVRWPLWLVIRNPTLRVLMASYNEDKATEFSRDSRKLAAKWVSFADDVNRVGEWQTTAGGGVFAAGIGGGATGRPFDVIVIDDPFKDRADADSLQRRETVWSWYTEVALTRRPKVVVIIATRWHEDDLTGRILSRTAAAGWESINLPALSEGEGDPLGRPYGEALCPEMMSREALEEQRELNPFSFSALYQGSPTTKEGAMCLVDRILEYDPDALPPELPRVRCWDIAASSNPKADQTAGVLIVGPDSEGTFYVSDVIAGHWEPSERNAKILEVAGDDGTGVPIWGPEDPGPHGKESAQAFVKLLEGYSVVTSPVLKRQGARPDSKALRAEPWIAQINGGHVRIPKGAPWSAAFLDQHRKFPHGRRDDMVDACALGMAALRHSRPPGDFGIF